MHSHQAAIVLADPETGALVALLDGRYITEARTAAVSAVSSRVLARESAASVAIIGSGVQARSHLEALSRVHRLSQVTVWSPNKERRDRFVDGVRRGSGPGSDTRLTRMPRIYSDHHGPRPRRGQRRRRHRPGDLVAHAGPRKRLGEAGRPRYLGRHTRPNQRRRDGSGARRSGRSCMSIRAPPRSSSPATSSSASTRGASARSTSSPSSASCSHARRPAVRTTAT